MAQTHLRREDPDLDRKLSEFNRDSDDHVAMAPFFSDASIDLVEEAEARTGLPSREIDEQMCLDDFPRIEMVVACVNCGQVLRFRTQRLIAEHGRKETISEVLALKSKDCECVGSGDCKVVLTAEPA